MLSYTQKGPSSDARPTLGAYQVEVRNGTGTGWTPTATKDLLANATGSINVNGQKITNGAAPTSPSDFATKAYVDTLSGDSFTLTTTATTQATMPCEDFTSYSDGDYQVQFYVTGRGSSHYGCVIFFMVQVTSGTPAITPANNGELMTGPTMANGATFDISVTGNVVNLLITPASALSTVWKNKVIVH